MKNKNIILITTGIILLSFFLAYILYFWNLNNTKNQAVNEPKENASVGLDLSKETEFTNKSLGITVKLPKELKVSDEYETSFLLVPNKEIIGQGYTNYIYFKDITNDVNEQMMLKKLNTLTKKGESINVTDTKELEKWYKFTYVNDAVIDSASAKVYENNQPWELPNGTTETKYIFEKNGKIYAFGYYTGGDANPAPLSVPMAYEIINSAKIN